MPILLAVRLAASGHPLQPRVSDAYVGQPPWTGVHVPASRNQACCGHVVPDMTTPQPHSEVADRWTQARIRNMLARVHGRPQIAGRERLRAQRRCAH